MDELEERKKRTMFCESSFVFHSLNSTFFDETLEWSNIILKNWSWDFLVTLSI